MVTGYFPTARHDGSSLQSTDRSLSRRGALAAKAAVIYIKGDWMEYVTTLSFPSWTHNVHPCPMCFCSPDTMCDLEGAYCDLTTTDHYIEECERREIHVVVDGSGHAKTRNSMEHHTPSGTRWTAREVRVDIPEYGLRALDRLEPTPWMSDYAMFDDTTRFLARFVFWCADEQAWTQHRNPLFDSRLGFVPQRMIVDALRCSFLGVVQRHCGHVIHQLLEHVVWQVGDAACEVRAEVSVLRLRDQFFGAGVRPRTRWPTVCTGWRTSRPACWRTAYAT